MPKTIGDTMKELTTLKTSKEATQYLLKALEENPNAWVNIKYLSGYLGNEERNKLLSLFRGD